MTDAVNIIGDIHACSDSKGLCRVLETHFTDTMKEHLLTALIDTKEMLTKSKQKTKDKKAFIPKYLENVDFVLHFLQLLGKIPAMLRTDQMRLNRITAANQRLNQIIADKDRVINIKQHEQLEQLEQYKSHTQILVKAKEKLEKEKIELDQKLWEMKGRLETKDDEENMSTIGECQPRDEAHCKVIKKIETQCDIVSEFKTLTTYGPWLNAKELLDKVLPDGGEEINKLQVLCVVIMIPWQAAKEHISKGAGQKTEMSLNEITDALKAHFARENKFFLNHWSMLTNTYPAIQEYVDQATCIAIAMAEHEPQLDYRLSDGKYLGENIQELQWGSVDPKIERYKVHDVYPNIYNGETMLEKGKVFLVDIKELDDTDSTGSTQSFTSPL